MRSELQDRGNDVHRDPIAGRKQPISEAGFGMSALVVRSDGITQVRVPLLARIVLWGNGLGWTVFTLGCRYSWPAHPDGFVPFSERMGHRKTYHLFGGCLVPRKRRRASS